MTAPVIDMAEARASIRRIRDAMDDAVNAAWLHAIREGRLRPPSMGAIPILGRTIEREETHE